MFTSELQNGSLARTAARPVLPIQLSPIKGASRNVWLPHG
jgi:hypothetical protein